jgi:isocitrate dehydrogenase
LEEGIHTYDIFKEGISTQKVGTREFADAVIARLGQKPETFKPVAYNPKPTDVAHKPTFTPTVPAKKELLGVDVFLHEAKLSVEEIAVKLQAAQTDTLELKLISNRGQKVWPNGFAETFMVDHWRCRFQNPQGGVVSHEAIIELLKQVNAQGLDFIKTEHLCAFDGVPGWSAAQGA